MNLTDTDDDFVYSNEGRTNSHLLISRTLSEARNIAEDRNKLGELGSIFSKLVAFKNKVTPGFVKNTLLDPVATGTYYLENKVVIPAAGKYGNIIAPVASFFGPWGKLVAVAVTMARADYVATQNAAKQLQATQGNANALLDQYNKVSGTIPGRVIGRDTLVNVLKAGVAAQKWPPITADNAKTPASLTYFQTIDKAAQQGIARGAVTANDVYTNEWPAIIKPNKYAVWMLPRDQYQAQLAIDALDDAMAELKPDMPFSYGVTDAAASDPATQATVTAAWIKAADEHALVPFTGTRQVRFGANGKFVTKTVTAQNGGVMCEDSVFGDPIFGTVKACYLLNSEDTAPTTATIPSVLTPSTPSPVASVTTVAPALSTDQQAMMQSLLNQLQQQGASQQQMNTALMSALQQTGVNTSSPGVQQAVASDVAATTSAAAQGTTIPTTAGGSSLSPLMLGGLAVVAAVFAFARPKKGSGRRTRTRSRRK